MNFVVKCYFKQMNFTYKKLGLRNGMLLFIFWCVSIGLYAMIYRCR